MKAIYECGLTGCPGTNYPHRQASCTATCDGCDHPIAPTEGAPFPLKLRGYRVTFHDDSESDVYYCDDCADLARMDWNGETKTIQPFHEAP